MHQTPCVHREQCGNRVLIRYAEGFREHERNQLLSSVLNATSPSTLKTHNSPYPSQSVQKLKPSCRPPPVLPLGSSSTTSISTYQTAVTRPTELTDTSLKEEFSSSTGSGRNNHWKDAPVQSERDPLASHPSNIATDGDSLPQLPQPRIEQPPARARTLHYRKAGIIFAPPHANSEVQIDPDTVIKVGRVLCKRIVRTQYFDDQPTKYMSARQVVEWHQYQVELTYTHLDIYSTPALTWPHRRLEHSLSLKRITRFGLMSPLEYTFFVRYPIGGSHHEATMHLFRVLSVTQCQEWYMALYRLLPDNVKPVCSPWCEVHIPILDMQVRLPLWTMNQDSIRYDITLQNVQEAVLDVLEKDPRWSKDFASKLGERQGLIMCWTRDNRTEWVYWRDSVNHAHKRIDLVVSPQHIEQTHRLELRHIEHGPSDIILANETTLREPPPVEGYLTWRTTFLGKQLAVAKLDRCRRAYVATFDQFLFIVTHPTEAMMPSSQACYVDAKLDTVYLTPYDTHDKPDMAELDRRQALMTGASKIIDLTELSHARHSFDEEDDTHTAAGRLESFSGMESSFSANSMAPLIDHHAAHTRDKRLLEMVMMNGIVLKFESESSETCDAWIQSLTNLSLYWRARHEAERDIHASQGFGDMLSDPYRHTIKGVEEVAMNFHRAPEVDTRFWNICWYTQCRDVVKSGVMYFQSKSRATFSQKMFVLTANGWLLYFNPFERMGVTCQPVQTAVHERKGKIDVSDCYVLTPASAEEDVEVEALPCRIFADGVVTSHSNDDCLFSLWKPDSRRVFSPRRQRLVVYGGRNGRRPYNSRFHQQHGETMQFLARNQHEKEEWVWAIHVVIEQLLRDQI